MKSLPILAALGFTAPFLFAQSPPVSSEIAGFVNFAIAGSAGSRTQMSFKSVGLVRPIEYKGYCLPVVSARIQDLSATWQTGEFNPPAATAETATHYLEITGGNRAGATFDIVATDGPSRTITLAQPLPRGFSGGYCVRKYWTLASLLGAQNEVGLQAGTALDADKVLIQNGSSYETYFYSTDQLLGTGWRRVGDGARDHSSRKLYPEDGLIFRRATGGEIRRLVKGVARKESTSIPVLPGVNLVGNVYPVPMTLASSRLFTANPTTGVRAGDANSADQVMIYNGSGYDSYYYLQSVTVAPGWRKLGDPVTDRGATVIPAGGALVVKRGGNAGFDWQVPAHPLP